MIQLFIRMIGIKFIVIRVGVRFKAIVAMGFNDLFIFQCTGLYRVLSRLGKRASDQYHNAVWCHDARREQLAHSD